jgi:hypothetical protein
VRNPGRRRARGDNPGPPPRADDGDQDGQGEQDERLDRHGRPGQPGGPAGPGLGQGQDGVEQQAGRHGVFWVAPPDRDAPQRGRARGGEQETPGAGHAETFGDRVGGEQDDGGDRDLVRSGQQPRAGMGGVRVGQPQGEPGRVDERDHRDQDDGRPGKRDQLGGRGVEAAQVEVHEPLGRDHRPPQVIGQRPARFPVVAGSPDRACHPGDDQDDRGQQRKEPPVQPRPGRGQAWLSSGHGLTHLSCGVETPAFRPGRKRRSSFRRVVRHLYVDDSWQDNGQARGEHGVAAQYGEGGPRRQRA